MEYFKNPEEQCLVCNQKDPKMYSEIDLCFGTYLVEINKRKSSTALSKLFYLVPNFVQSINESFICLSCIQRLAEIESMFCEIEFLNARIIQLRHFIQEQLTAEPDDGNFVDNQDQQQDQKVITKNIEREVEEHSSSSSSQSVTQETRRKISHIIQVHDRVKIKMKSQNVNVFSKENLQESMSYIPTIPTIISEPESKDQNFESEDLDIDPDQEKENSLKLPEIAFISKHTKLNLTTECLEKLQLQPSISLEHIRTSVDQKFKLNSLYIQNFIKREQNRLRMKRQIKASVVSKFHQDRRIKLGEIIKNVRNKLKVDGSTSGLSKYFIGQDHISVEAQNNQNKSEESTTNNNFNTNFQNLPRNFVRKKRKRPRCYEERNPKKCNKCGRTFVDKKSFASHYHKYHNQR